MAMLRWSALSVAVLVAGLARMVEAACPNDLSDCLGNAAGFEIVAQKVSMNRGTVCETGEGCGVVPSLSKEVCAGRAFVGGPSALLAPRSQVTNLIASGPFLYPVIFLDQTGPYDGVGVLVLGDVVTGGGGVRGVQFAQINGVVDESGSDPRASSCAGALLDAEATSDALAALTPTASLGRVNLAPDEFLDFEAGPGVNVVEMSELTLRARTPLFDQVRYSGFGIVLDPATEAVVINTQRLSVGTWCYIWVSGDPTKVIINVPSGRRVFFKPESQTYPTVLAPRSTAGFRFGHARQVIARQVMMRGGCVGDITHAYCHL